MDLRARPSLLATVLLALGLAIAPLAACGSDDDASPEGAPTTTAATPDGAEEPTDEGEESKVPEREAADDETIALAKAIVHDEADLPGWERFADPEPFATDGVDPSDCYGDDERVLADLPVGAMAASPTMAFGEEQAWVRSWSAVFESEAAAEVFLEVVRSDAYRECQAERLRAANDFDVELDASQEMGIAAAEEGSDGGELAAVFAANFSVDGGWAGANQQLTFQFGRAVLTVIVDSGNVSPEAFERFAEEEADAREAAFDRVRAILGGAGPS